MQATIDSCDNNNQIPTWPLSASC